MGDLVKQIRREREAVSYGIYGVHTVESVGKEADPARLLYTNIAHEHVDVRDPQSVGAFIIPYELQWNDQLGRAAVNRLAGMLIGSVYELLSEDKDRWEREFSHAPEMQFLRWIRNGIYHGNRFVLDDYDPGSAEWRGWEITMDMEGDVVFTELKDMSFPSRDAVPIDESRRAKAELEDGFMEAGDAYALIDDVVQIIEDRGIN